MDASKAFIHMFSKRLTDWNYIEKDLVHTFTRGDDIFNICIVNGIAVFYRDDIFILSINLYDPTPIPLERIIDYLISMYNIKGPIPDNMKKTSSNVINRCQSYYYLVRNNSFLKWRQTSELSFEFNFQKGMENCVLIFTNYDDYISINNSVFRKINIEDFKTLVKYLN